MALVRVLLLVLGRVVQKVPLFINHIRLALSEETSSKMTPVYNLQQGACSHFHEVQLSL